MSVYLIGICIEIGSWLRVEGFVINLWVIDIRCNSSRDYSVVLVVVFDRISSVRCVGVVRFKLGCIFVGVYMWIVRVIVVIFDLFFGFVRFIVVKVVIEERV